MEKAVRFEKPGDVRNAVGQEVCVTDWMTVDQTRIDKFAEATGDFQWIHVDVERAKSSPYGGTIAHGFLTLSLLGGFYEPYLQHAFPFCDLGLNYGLNKVRFTAPVRSGSRVRGRIVLAKVDDVEGGLQLTSNITMEIEGQERPALVAESLVRRYFEKSAR
ncbi:MAG TPA: MaoC family dehydratase [Burkholderiaceae bacterium]|nr:MaoC family dehydratase [Burkholderiaceae bacterium]